MSECGGFRLDFVVAFLSVGNSHRNAGIAKRSHENQFGSYNPLRPGGVTGSQCMTIVGSLKHILEVSVLNGQYLVRPYIPRS